MTIRLLCNGKTMYDKKGAVTARNRRMKEDHIELREYQCPLCGYWHLTKQITPTYNKWKKSHKPKLQKTSRFKRQNFDY